MDIWNDTEFERLSNEVVTARKRMVEYLRSKPQTISKNYVFSDGDNTYSLGDLFGDREDLLLIHNMGVACRHCTLWADGVNGLLPHLESRAAVVLVNEDPIETQHRIAATRGWTLTMRRDTDGSFTRDMGFAQLQDGKNDLMPGVSAFHRDADGTITRVASDTFGPGDLYMPVYPFFELLKDGIGSWEPDAKPKLVTIDLPDRVTAASTNGTNN